MGILLTFLSGCWTLAVLLLTYLVYVGVQKVTDGRLIAFVVALVVFCVLATAGGLVVGFVRTWRKASRHQDEVRRRMSRGF